MNHIHHTGSTFGVGIDNKIVRNVNENLFSYLVSSGFYSSVALVKYELDDSNE